MLHDLLEKYLSSIESSIEKLPGAYVEIFRVVIFSPTRLQLSLRVRFRSGHLFEGNEAIAVELDQIRHLAYRYHFQDKGNSLVFRYDDAPHFRGLPFFPHHKHTSRQAISCSKPDLVDVLGEVVSTIVSGRP